MIGRNLAVLLVLSCVVTDLRWRKIPNALTLTAPIVAFALGGFISGWSGLGDAVLGYAVGLALFAIPYRMGGMGAGDVKLLAAVGAFVGFPAIFQVALYVALAGGLIALIVIIKNRTARQAMAGTLSTFLSLLGRFVRPISHTVTATSMTTSVGSIPYGVAIAAGTLAYYSWGRLI